MRRCLERCPECFAAGDDGRAPVPGEGPRDARVMCVGEGPGKMESNIGRPFIGPTGKELRQLYMPLAGLVDSECWISNSFCCKYADSSDTPDMSIVKSCAEFHLKKQIEMVRPEYIVLMGGIANRMAGITIDIDAVHGSGREWTVLGHNCKVFSTLHPARGLHDGKTMEALLNDFTTLRGFLAGDVKPLVDAYPDAPCYRLRSSSDVDDILHGMEDSTWFATDTESRKSWLGYPSTIKYTPHCATFAIGPSESFLVDMRDRLAMKRYLHYLQQFRKITCHHVKHDAKVIEDMAAALGVADFQFPWHKAEDTMEMVFQDGRFISKGLKVVAYHLLGAIMRNFDDVVIPYGRLAAVEYIEAAIGIQWPEPVQEKTGERVTRKCKDCGGKGHISVGRGKLRRVYDCEACGTCGFVDVDKMTRKQSLNQKLNRLLTDLAKNHEIDVWERWNAWAESTGVQPMIDQIGPIPLPSVEMAPEDELAEYAGADAVATWRIRPVLRKRLVEIRRMHCS